EQGLTLMDFGAGRSSERDREAVLLKYELERAKRLRPAGIKQYIRMSGDYERYLADPWAAAPPRLPKKLRAMVAVVGGGLGGLLCAGRLLDVGVPDIVVVEKGGDFGGTWYWNRYPGIRCDVESYVYMPLLEETGYMPSERYATGAEIQDHCRRIATHYGLYELTLFSTSVSSLAWSLESRSWQIRTDVGDHIDAQFVILCLGNLHRPKLPGIPGIDTFGGRSFHTSRWDYSYTGGGPDERLPLLWDKRVGVIGTGASAVQVVPPLADSARSLHVFQRTPSSVDVRDNHATDQDWAASLGPGWQRRRMESFAALTSVGLAITDEVNDAWTDVSRRLIQRMTDLGVLEVARIGIDKLVEEIDFEKMEEIRRRVDSIVMSRADADALKPWYRRMCKRPCFHDEYLQVFNRDNVHLVDTDGRGVDEIVSSGVRVRDEVFALDCMIFATGFEVGTPFSSRAGFDPVGASGRSLTEHWLEGARSLFGIHVNDFPNLFLVGSTQAVPTANYPHLLDETSRHLACLLE